MKVIYLLLVIVLFSCRTNESISRDTLEDKMGIEIDEPQVNIQSSKDYSEIESLIEAGNSESDLYKSYKILKKAKEQAISEDYPLDEIEPRLRELEEIVDISVEFYSGINTDLTSFIEGEINNRGFNARDNGLLTLSVELITEPVSLNNEYYNKVWYLSIKLLDSKGTVIETEYFNARESQISDENLDTMIIFEAKKELKKLIKKVLK